MIDHKIYDRAQDADASFQSALVDEFGEERAGDMRYQPSHWTPKIRLLAEAFDKAADDWREEMSKLTLTRQEYDALCAMAARGIDDFRYAADNGAKQDYGDEFDEWLATGNEQIAQIEKAAKRLGSIY